MTTEAQTCAIGILANRRLGRRIVLNLGHFDFEIVSDFDIRISDFASLGPLHLSRVLYKFTPFYAKQSQFAEYSNKRKTCYNNGLCQFTPAQPLQKQSQNKPNSKPIKANQTQYKPKTNPIKPNFYQKSGKTCAFGSKTCAFDAKTSALLKPPPKPPNPMQEKDLQKFLAKLLKNQMNIFDTFPTNTFPCSAAWISYFSPFCFSPPSLVLVYSLCSLRSPRFISLSFYFCLSSTLVSRETFCLNNLYLPNILATQMTTLVLSKMRNRTMDVRRMLPVCLFLRQPAGPSSYQAGSRYGS